MANTEDPLRDFYKTLAGKGMQPLEPDDRYYVPILEETPEKDPILKLGQRIDWAESESVDLLTGFRGNGKSTELRRLKRDLEAKGCRVFMLDMLEYVMMTKPLEITDFVLSLMAGLTQEASRVGLTEVSDTYWQRLVQFLQSEVQLGELRIGARGGTASADLGMRLKTEPTFKQRVQQHLRGHVTRLIQEAQDFASALVDAIRERDGDPDEKVVVLVDSLEQLRGVGLEAEDVHRSVLELLSGEAANLRFPKLHVVYTTPPYLLPLAPNLGRNLGGDPVVSWPNVHVRHMDGSPDPIGLEKMERIVAQRYPHWHTIFAQEQLHRLATSAGGDIRDFFRLIRECLVALSTAYSDPHAAVADAGVLDEVEQQLRNELLPLPEDDAQWLAEVHTHKEPVLQSKEGLPRLAHFFDANLILNYLNRESWYDIHPLLEAEVVPRCGGRGAPG